MGTRRETVGADNCGCAVKLTFTRWYGEDGEELEGVEVVKHCGNHGEAT